MVIFGVCYESWSFVWSIKDKREQGLAEDICLISEEGSASPRWRRRERGRDKYTAGYCILSPLSGHDRQAFCGKKDDAFGLEIKYGGQVTMMQRPSGLDWILTFRYYTKGTTV